MSNETESGGAERALRFDSPGGAVARCPHRVGARLRRLKHAIDGVRLKIEGLTILGDMLGERFSEATSAPPPCEADRGDCPGASCALARAADRLEDAFDRVAQRVDALNRAVTIAQKVAREELDARSG